MIGLGADKNWKNTFMNNCIQVINWWKKPVQENEICNHDNEQIKANRYQNTISVPICPYSVIVDIIPFVIVIIIVLEIPAEVLVCLMKKKCVKTTSKIFCLPEFLNFSFDSWPALWQSQVRGPWRLHPCRQTSNFRTPSAFLGDLQFGSFLRVFGMIQIYSWHVCNHQIHKLPLSFFRLSRY